jgi:hypothetical protein
LFHSGGEYPLLGDGNNDPLEIDLDFNYFYSNDDVGKLFLFIYNQNTPAVGELLQFSLVDKRWNEEFELADDYEFTQQLISDPELVSHQLRPNPP